MYFCWTLCNISRLSPPLVRYTAHYNVHLQLQLQSSHCEVQYLMEMSLVLCHTKENKKQSHARLTTPTSWYFHMEITTFYPEIHVKANYLKSLWRIHCHATFTSFPVSISPQLSQSTQKRSHKNTLKTTLMKPTRNIPSEEEGNFRAVLHNRKQDKKQAGLNPLIFREMF